MTKQAVMYFVQGFTGGKSTKPESFTSASIAQAYAIKLGKEVRHVVMWPKRVDSQDEQTMSPGNNADRDLAERGKQKQKKKPSRLSDPGLPGSQRGKPKPIDPKGPKKR